MSEDSWMRYCFIYKQIIKFFISFHFHIKQLYLLCYYNIRKIYKKIQSNVIYIECKVEVEVCHG